MPLGPRTWSTCDLPAGRGPGAAAGLPDPFEEFEGALARCPRRRASVVQHERLAVVVDPDRQSVCRRHERPAGQVERVADGLAEGEPSDLRRVAVSLWLNAGISAPRSPSGPGIASTS